MSIIDSLDRFADKGLRFIDEHSWWFFGVGSALVYFSFVIPVIMSEGFNLLFVSSMLLAAPMIGWLMMVLYILPFGLIQMFCYCVRNPLDAFLKVVRFAFYMIALFLLALYIHSL